MTAAEKIEALEKIVLELSVKAAEHDGSIKTIINVMNSGSKKKKDKKKESSNGEKVYKLHFHSDELDAMAEFSTMHMNCACKVFAVDMNVTGIGNTVSITCGTCNKTKKITGVESW